MRLFLEGQTRPLETFDIFCSVRAIWPVHLHGAFDGLLQVLHGIEPRSPRSESPLTTDLSIYQLKFAVSNINNLKTDD